MTNKWMPYVAFGLKGSLQNFYLFFAKEEVLF